MLHINGCTINTARGPNDLFERDLKTYFEPPFDFDVIESLKAWSLSLVDGALIQVRGRDISRGEDGAIRGFTEWEEGLALKTEDSFFLLWGHLVEKLQIKSINFYEQLHFQCSPDCSDLVNEESANIASCDVLKQKHLPIIVLCHGFCPESGPHYALICALGELLQTSGFVVIVPDFRESYQFGSGRARSERVRVLVEELLCLAVRQRDGPHAPLVSPVILIGHSQGGAAVAQACASARVVTCANIQGIILLGAESPIEHVRPEEAVQMALLMGEPSPEPSMVTHTHRPDGMLPGRLLFIHSSQDRVIHHGQIQQLAELWGATYLELQCDAQPEHPDVSWANDLQHDFLTLRMLRSVVHEVFTFISK